ncbi:recQ-mediated genome instability protein 1-like isoform X3 [Vespula maculifrons]|uniref:RecQ-mediated genome instability protein 1-like isoform X3 n=1 Tax=Vespula maculifrons TaxID=7453 RepID=A0ABD2CW86_VESMC
MKFNISCLPDVYLRITKKQIKMKKILKWCKKISDFIKAKELYEQILMEILSSFVINCKRNSSETFKKHLQLYKNNSLHLKNCLEKILFNVAIASKVIERFYEFSINFPKKRKLAKINDDIEHELRMTYHNAKLKLKQLNALLKLKLKLDRKIKVVNIRSSESNIKSMTTNPSITSYLQNWFDVQFIKEVKRRKKQVLYMILIDANTPIDTIPTCCPITAKRHSSKQVQIRKIVGNCNKRKEIVIELGSGRITFCLCEFFSGLKRPEREEWKKGDGNGYPQFSVQSNKVTSGERHIHKIGLQVLSIDLDKVY